MFVSSISDTKKAIRFSVVYRDLAVGALESGDSDGALFWSQREISVMKAALSLLRQGTNVDSDDLIYSQNRVTEPMLIVAAALKAKGEWPQALAVLQNALRLTTEPVQQSKIAIGLAEALLRLSEDTAEVLRLTHGARSLAPENASCQYESYLLEAEAQLQAMNYSAAMEALDAGLKFTRMAGALAFECQLSMMKIEILRGSVSLTAAQQTLNDLLEGLDRVQADALGASVRIAVICSVIEDPDWHDSLWEMVRWLERVLRHFPNDDPRVQRYMPLRLRLQRMEGFLEHVYGER